MPRRQLANPVLVAGQEIDLQRQPDDEGGEIPLGAPDLLDIFIQLIQAHAPVVEIVPLHRRMIGKADFIQAQLERARGVFHRLARGMPAKRRVHMIICWPTHGPTVERVRRKVE